MANKSSFLLAVLFIANPFVLLFYQNCSAVPRPQAEMSPRIDKQPASVSERTNPVEFTHYR